MNSLRSWGALCRRRCTTASGCGVGWAYGGPVPDDLGCFFEHDWGPLSSYWGLRTYKECEEDRECPQNRPYCVRRVCHTTPACSTDDECPDELACFEETICVDPERI